MRETNAGNKPNVFKEIGKIVLLVFMGLATCMAACATAQAYSLDGDLNAARQRLALLGEGDPGARVAQRGEQAIAEGLPPSYIGTLARLAAALGARSPALSAYLTR